MPCCNFITGFNSSNHLCIMKKRFTLLAVAGLVFGINLKGVTYISIPPAEMTGAPGDSNCTSCHSGSLNSGGGSVTLLNPPANYVPGTTYTMQIQVNEAGRTRFGFQVVALDGRNLQAGTFTLSNPANTSSQVSRSKTYVSHRNASGNNTWTFTWKAPANNVGPVTFYFSGNAANGNNSDSGDNVYTSQIVLTPAAPNGVSEDKNNAIVMYPNPANAKLNVNLPEKAGMLKVVDIAGKEVFSNNSPENKNELDVSRYPNGTYFLKMEQKKTAILKRFVVQH